MTNFYKKLSFITLLFFLNSSLVFADDNNETGEPGDLAKYQFDKFPAEESFSGKPVAPIFNKYWHWRTAIRNQISKGSNFSGIYTIITWGCGSGCQISVLYNPRTGKLYALGATVTSLVFRKDSRLLILNPGDPDPENFRPDIPGFNEHYMLWDGTNMKNIPKEKAVKNTTK